MRCQMCGARLKKEGNICKNCYAKYKEEKELFADNEQEIFSVKRKYSPAFNLMKNGEIIVFGLIVVLAGFSSYNIWIGILLTILCLVVLGVLMFFNKKRAKGTKITFCETKLRYRAKYPLVDKEEVIPYKNIKDMAYFQTRSQKKFGIGDIRFYTQGFLSGLTVCDIPDIEENFEKMRDIINSTR